MIHFLYESENSGLQVPEWDKPCSHVSSKLSFHANGSTPSQIKRKGKQNIIAFMWFAVKAAHSPVPSSSADLILSLLTHFSSVLYTANGHLNHQKWIALPFLPHPGNQTQIENIQPPISVPLSIFPIRQYDVTFPGEPVGWEGGDNISGLWMRFEFHCPISFKVSNWAICFLYP